jgi:tetratricopeptide (TPR) repeat protein
MRARAFLSPVALGLLAMSFQTTIAVAQGPAKLDREMTFVRGLARDLGLVSVAETELARLESEFKTASDQDRVLQLRVEVSLFGARIKQNRIEQRSDYKKALLQSKELLERSSDATVQRDARATLAEAAQEFGQFLNEELDVARTESPTRVAELEQEAKDVFALGGESCVKVMQALQEGAAKDPQTKLEYGLAWMRKGVLLREHGRAIKQDREVQTGRAINELEEMVLEYGEETALGLRGLFEIAQCREVAGNTADAIASYSATIQQIGVTLNAEDNELSGDTLAFLFDMMQEVYAHLGELLFEQGDTAAATEMFLSFRDNLAKNGEKGLDPLEICDPRFGHLTFLAECRFLAESGDAAKVQQALTMAQKINDKHPSDYVGIKAKAVLRQILDRQRNLVSGSLLFEIAKGEYQNKNYEEGIKGLRRALATMSPEEQRAIGLEAYDLLGKIFAATDRFLESLIAFEQGLKRFGKREDGTESPLASDMADRLDRTVTQLKSISKNDPALQPLFAMAEPTVLAYSTAGAGKVHWKNGNDRMAESKWTEAVDAFAQVPKEFLQYELARANLIRMQFFGGKIAEATQSIADYRSWLASKEAVLDPKRADKAQVRESAIRRTDYTEAAIAYAQAYGDATLKLQRDPAKYPAAIALMQAFVANHGKSKEATIAQALDALGRMHADLGELDKAEASYLQIKDLDEQRASKLASVIFGAYLTHTANLDKELDAAVSADKDKAGIEKLRNDITQMRTRLCNLGVDYIRSSGKPQLGILVNTMNAFEKLGDWKKVDEVAQKALQLYGTEAEAKTKEVIDLTIRPKIGEALLEQRQFQQALDMLLAAEKANPNQYELKRLVCKALGGWFYLNNRGKPVKEPGLGRYKEAYDKYYSEYRTWAQRPAVQKYSIDWYRFQWECYWYAKQAGEQDSTYKGYAASIYRTTGALDKFAGLKALGQDGMNLFTYFDLNRP